MSDGINRKHGSKLIIAPARKQLLASERDKLEKVQLQQRFEKIGGVAASLLQRCAQATRREPISGPSVGPALTSLPPSRGQFEENPVCLGSSSNSSSIVTVRWVVDPVVGCPW